MNTALIITAIAGLSIGGLSLNNGSTGSAAAPAAGEIRSTLPGVEDTVVTLNLDDPGMLGVLQSIAESFGVTLELSPESRGWISANRMMTAGSVFQGEFTLEGALAEFRKAFRVGWVGIEVALDDKSVVMTSNEERLRDSVETRVYAVPSWLLYAENIYDYSQTLKRLLEVKFDLEYASIETVSDAIVVAAPPEIQKEVVKMMHELDAIMQARQEEQRADAERMKAEQDERNRNAFAREKEAMEAHQAKLDQAIVRVQNEFDDARVTLLQSKHHLREVQAEQSMLIAAANGLVPLENLNEDAGSIDERLMGIAAQIDDLELKVDENEERYTYLRTRLLDSRYTSMFNGLD